MLGCVARYTHSPYLLLLIQSMINHVGFLLCFPNLICAMVAIDQDSVVWDGLPSFDLKTAVDLHTVNSVEYHHVVLKWFDAWPAKNSG